MKELQVKAVRETAGKELDEGGELRLAARFAGWETAFVCGAAKK
jgi:hypothetical protein